MRADIDLGFDVCLRNQPIRLFGIDTPEVRGKDKVYGKAVWDIVRSRLLECGEGDVWMYSVRDAKGKYGRYLGIIILPSGENLNTWLVQEGHAVPFMV